MTRHGLGLGPLSACRQQRLRQVHSTRANWTFPSAQTVKIEGVRSARTSRTLRSLRLALPITRTLPQRLQRRKQLQELCSLISPTRSMTSRHSSSISGRHSPEVTISSETWYARRDSNPRPSASEPLALRSYATEGERVANRRGWSPRLCQGGGCA
jgi:hypothetical protein